MLKRLHYYNGSRVIKQKIQSFVYLNELLLTKISEAMSHERSKEQVKVKKDPAKSLKEKRAAKKAKKAEKGRL
jgi:hypothetical protein